MLFIEARILLGMVTHLPISDVIDCFAATAAPHSGVCDNLTLMMAMLADAMQVC